MRENVEGLYVKEKYGKYQLEDENMRCFIVDHPGTRVIIRDGNIVKTKMYKNSLVYRNDINDILRYRIMFTSYHDEYSIREI